MKYGFRSILILASAIGALASPTQNVLSSSKPRPLVIWHGLGDSYDSPGILKFRSAIEEMHPGIFIHSVYVDPDSEKDLHATFYGNIDEQVELVARQLKGLPGILKFRSAIEEMHRGIFKHSVYVDPDSKKDLHATFYGNVDEQVELVARQLKGLPLLSDGFDAIGFSQGGQFLRAYIERHNDPPVRNLITFGSQHMGVSDIPPCKPYDLLCNLARNAVRAGVYSEWAQQNLVQAQYYRDPAQLERYLESNHFLSSINNERPAPHKNETYAANLAQLDALVLVLFTQDRTVIPKESSWFGSYPSIPTPEREEEEDGGGKAIVSMREQPLYNEDWIGLRTLDESGRVVLVSCDAEHMHLSLECWQPLVEKYVGSRS